MVLNGANCSEWRERQIAFFQVETSHFPLSKFQGGSHNTYVGYATNDRSGGYATNDQSGEPLTRKKHISYGTESTSEIPNFVLVGNCEEKPWNLFSVILLCFKIIHTFIDSKLNTFFRQHDHFGI